MFYVMDRLDFLSDGYINILKFANISNPVNQYLLLATYSKEVFYIILEKHLAIMHVVACVVLMRHINVNAWIICFVMFKN